MFLSIRDLRFAKGRFALMSSALFLISLMVVMLSGLTTGLGNQSIAASSTSAPTTSRSVNPQRASRSRSANPPSPNNSATLWPRRPVSTRPRSSASRRPDQQRQQGGAASAFGVDGDSFAAPVPLDAGSAAVDADLAKDNGWDAGSRITIGAQTFTITALVDDSLYSHQPVVWIDHGVWTQLPSAGGSDGTVVALRTSGGFDADGAAAATGTSITDQKGALDAIGSYTSERGSLLLMQAMLMTVSALVVGAFFTVWTIQRSQDLAVLKAVGASTKYLLKDALGQSLIVLVLGAGLGALAAAGLGAIASQFVPFTLTLTGTLVPFVALIVMGMVGATAALARIVSIDPQSALATAR